MSIFFHATGYNIPAWVLSRANGTLPVSMHYQPGKQDVDIDMLIPPSSRSFTDPGKLARHGPFDWNKYTPIIAETDGTSLWLMDGMTRVENARRAGIASLPANVYRR
jgi:hypothetical protein